MLIKTIFKSFPLIIILASIVFIIGLNYLEVILDKVCHYLVELVYLIGKK